MGRYMCRYDCYVVWMLLYRQILICHRRRKRGGEGATRPPNFTHCLHNELHCSIVDLLHVGIVPQGNHIFVV